MSRKEEELQEVAEIVADYLRKWHYWPMSAVLELDCDEGGEPYARLRLAQTEGAE